MCYQPPGKLFSFLYPPFPSLFIEPPRSAKYVTGCLLSYPTLAYLCINIQYHSTVEKGLKVDLFASDLRADDKLLQDIKFLFAITKGVMDLTLEEKARFRQTLPQIFSGESWKLENWSVF